MEGGGEEHIVPAAGMWDAGADGLYLMSENSTIERYDFNGKRHTTVAKLGRFGVQSPLSVSPDGKHVIFRYEQRATIEIDMLQGFR